VLLEKHPLQGFSALNARFGRERRAAGTWPLGFLARNSGVRLSPRRISISIA
jgi:hypothetical protein